MGVTNLPLNANASQIRAAWGPGDAGSLLEVALTWSRFEQLDPTTQFWIVHLWSPGLSVLEVPLIWLESSLNIPLFFSLLSVTVMVLVGTFIIFRRVTQTDLGRIALIFIVFAVLHSWDFQYILRDGIFYTEGIGFALLLSGLASLTAMLIHNETKIKLKYVIPGVFIGISIWVRHTSDLSLMLLLSASLIAWIALAIVNKKKHQIAKKTRHRSINTRSTESLKLIFLSAAVALLVTMPWRIISQSVFEGVPYVMSSASAGVGEGLWVDEKKDPNFYWIPYNMNWACNIDAEKCDLINSHSSEYSNQERRFEAVKSAVKHPLKYAKERGKFLFKSWIPGFNSSANLVWKITGTIPILIYLGIVFLFLKIKSNKKWEVLLIWLPFIFLLGCQLLIIHFESRYFIPIRLLTYGLFISLLGLFLDENPEYDKKYKGFKQLMTSRLSNNLKLTRD